eukprot:Trichotokara_eunicae@DN2603_c0_g1_i1.p1
MEEIYNLAIESWTRQAHCYNYAPSGTTTEHRDCVLSPVVADLTQFLSTGTSISPDYVSCTYRICEEAILMICWWAPGGNTPGVYPFSISVAERLNADYPGVTG